MKEPDIFGHAFADADFRTQKLAALRKERTIDIRAFWTLIAATIGVSAYLGLKNGGWYDGWVTLLMSSFFLSGYLESTIRIAALTAFEEYCRTNQQR